jgi:hypothetical protein
VSGDEDVVRLEIAMHDALRVRCTEGGQNFHHEARQRSGCQTTTLGEEIGEHLPIQELHDDVRPAVGQPVQIQDVDDALVPDQVDRPGLGKEPLDQLGAVGAVVREDLDSDAAADRRVDPFVDAAHPTHTDHLRDPVGPEHGAEQWILAASHQRDAILSAESAFREGLAALGAHVHRPST